MPDIHRHRDSTYELDDQRWRIDLARVHGWLSTSTWSPGVTRDVVERAAHGSSLVLGAYHVEGQVGYLRVVSDRATIAWLADVFVAPAHRGRGIARAMLRRAMADPAHRQVQRWLLGGREPHPFRAATGFAPVADDHLLLELVPPRGPSP